MHEMIVDYFRCPLSGEKLSLKIIDHFNHPASFQKEIKSGYLLAEKGGIYPIVNGIPRMLPESFLNYSKELINWYPEYDSKSRNIKDKFKNRIEESVRRNRKIQQTFGFEWKLLKRNKEIKVWDLDAMQFRDQLFKELKLPEGFSCELVLDAGCGHGKSAMNMADFSRIVFGVEVSQAVEIAYEHNNKLNCHFLQADIHALPFSNESFNIVYCSGVLHHNPSTRVALQKLSTMVKKGGILCIWLYHPFKNILHYIMRGYRLLTRHLPIAFVYYFNAITITPLQWVISRVSGKKKKFIEISIEQLDMLTPAYRHEHNPEEVKEWMMVDGFTKIVITDSNNYGFSLKGHKENKSLTV